MKILVAAVFALSLAGQSFAQDTATTQANQAQPETALTAPAAADVTPAAATTTATTTISPAVYVGIAAVAAVGIAVGISNNDNNHQTNHTPGTTK
jgi:hypothetical protein